MEQKALLKNTPRIPGLITALLALLLASVSAPLLAQDETVPDKATLIKKKKSPKLEDAPKKEVEIVSARLKSSKPGHRAVRELERLRKGGGRLDWSPQDWIAYDRRGEDEFYDVYISQLDGSKESCLTCENFDFRKMNVLNPVWHPSGDFLVVQVQKNAKKLQLNPAQLTTPFQGLHSDLYLISRDGRFVFQITKIRERGGAVFNPFFSFEADRLIWSERITNKTQPWGDWGIRVAEFSVKRSVPRLGSIKTYPSNGWRDFRTASTLTPNDRAMLVAATLPAAAFDQGLDLFEIDLKTQQPVPLTSDTETRDDQARYTPKGEHILWTSNRGLERPRSGAIPWRNDLWIMRAEAQPGIRRSQSRLTFFNDPNADEYLGEALITDYAFSPEGDRILLHVMNARRDGDVGIEQAFYLLVLDPSYRR